MRKTRYQYMAAVFVLVLCLGIMTGCKKGADTSATATNTPAESTALPVETAGQSEEMPAKTPESSKVPAKTAKPMDDAATVELPIYTINDTTLECEDTVAIIPSDEKITSRVIVDAVADSFLQHGVEIGIDSIDDNGSSVIVSFKSDMAPISNTGSTVESTILDCISQSLLDNLEECTSVIFRMDGKQYESGHNMFGMEEAYLSK